MLYISNKPHNHNVLKEARNFWFEFFKKLSICIVKIVIGFVIQYILSTGAGRQSNQIDLKVEKPDYCPYTKHVKTITIVLVLYKLTKEYWASDSVSGKFTGCTLLCREQLKNLRSGLPWTDSWNYMYACLLKLLYWE